MTVCTRTGSESTAAASGDSRPISSASVAALSCNDSRNRAVVRSPTFICGGTPNAAFPRGSPARIRSTSVRSPARSSAPSPTAAAGGGPAVAGGLGRSGGHPPRPPSRRSPRPDRPADCRRHPPRPGTPWRPRPGRPSAAEPRASGWQGRARRAVAGAPTPPSRAARERPAGPPRARDADRPKRLRTPTGRSAALPTATARAGSPPRPRANRPSRSSSWPPPRASRSTPLPGGREASGPL